MWRTQRANRVIDRLLYLFSLYGMPLAIGALSVIGLASWHSQYAFDSGTAIPFQVLEETGTPLTPEAALLALEARARTEVEHTDTHLSEAPFWLRFVVSPTTGTGDTRIEFPSRHAREIACWDAGTMKVIGAADRESATGGFRPAKAGFALAVDVSKPGLTLLCRTRSAGPARISLLLWSAEQLQNSALQHHHRLGVIEGGLLMLSAFVLLAALITRESLYVIFAVWLVANLRLAALSAGWDTQWLGREVPLHWIFPMRKLTMAAYYLLTYTLFSRLFVDDLKHVGFDGLLRLAQWLGLPLLLFAIFLPYGVFLPFMWAIVAIGAAILVFLVIRILLLRRSSVASLYAASIGITLFSGVYEVVAAALGVKALIGVTDSVTAAASSSLMAALAMAAQMRQERIERVQAQAELRSTYEAIPVGLFTLDAKGDFHRFNPALKGMLGIEAAEDTNLRWQDFFAESTWDQLRQAAVTGGEIDLSGRPGSLAASKVFHVKATLADGRVEGSLQDITDRARATERLQYLAQYDPLTNVLNRRGIEKILEAVAAELSGRNPLVIAYLDLDRFKLINDLFGHPTGDEVLREICRRIGAELGPDQHIGRVGGDEFVIVFRRTPLPQATAICRRLIGCIENEPCRIGEKAFQVKGSIGLIEVADSAAASEAISVADRACREAKRAPANLVIYDRQAAAFRERTEELQLIGRFGVGRVPEGLFLEMQPIMSLHAPWDSLNFEALLRLREPDGSITPAGKIINAAESNGRISLIDRWVLSTLLQWLADHRSRLAKTNFVCLNLSGASLNDEKFVQDAYAMLAAAGDNARLLCFEITEGVALHDLDNTNRFIDNVRGFGAKVALDDFGAGYTSFSYLKQLAADAVKIDGSFVRDVNSHPANLAIVEAIAELSHNLGMKCIAEWAEDWATVEALAEIGVDYVQGFVLARPMAPERLLTARSAAELIEDPLVADRVRDRLGEAGPMALWRVGAGFSRPH